MHSLMTDDQNMWDEKVLSDLFNERDRLFIHQVPIPRYCRPDSWYWILEDKGDFSVKSCYRQIRGEYTYDMDGFWKQLWGLKLPGKIINMVWRVCKGVLPTATELVKKGLYRLYVCVVSWTC